MDKETRKTFDKQQARLEKPACFGKYANESKCYSCWFHPDCKNGEAKPEKSEGEKLSRTDIMDLLDDFEIEYDKRGKKADLEKLLNEAMK